MPAFSIKPASRGDIPTIISIQERTWEPTYRHILSKEQIDYMFEKIYAPDALAKQMKEGQEFYVLVNENVPEGFAAFSEEEPERFKLHKIYVLPSTQGTGAGKFLLAAIEDIVRGKNGKVLALNVNRFNKAKTFYEKMGYVVQCEKDIPIGPYWMNDYILEKSL